MTAHPMALHPGHAALMPFVGTGWDAVTLPQLNAWLAAAAAPPTSGSGALIAFVHSASAVSALEYECGIHRTGVVPLRPGNRHDLFNALCWLCFPRFKRACNALHAATATARRRGSADGRGRGPVRDALTLLDESGVLVLCADAALASLLRDRQWKMLFCARRTDVLRSLRFLACGHALHEKLLAPYPSLTGKALILDAPDALLDESPQVQRGFADRQVAQAIEAGLEPSQLMPLPLLGIPGWNAANDLVSFYDDTSVFRPARSAIIEGNATTVGQSSSAPASFNSSADP